MHGIKIRKKYIRFSLHFSDQKTKEIFSVWVSLNISLIFLPTWTDYHLNYLCYYSKKESTFETKIALSMQEAMDFIKQLEIENKRI